jgi:Flp pilus assembly pilin Flp
MTHLLRNLWKDDCGALLSAEFLFISTILVIGVIVGLSTVRAALNAELSELANAILALSQGYTVSGQSGSTGSVDGSGTFDTPGLVTGPISTPPAIPSFIDVPIQ